MKLNTTCRFYRKTADGCVLVHTRQKLIQRFVFFLEINTFALDLNKLEKKKKNSVLLLNVRKKSQIITLLQAKYLLFLMPPPNNGRKNNLLLQLLQYIHYCD